MFKKVKQIANVKVSIGEAVLIGMLVGMAVTRYILSDTNLVVSFSCK